MALLSMLDAAFCGSVPPFPRSCLAHRTGDPSIFARPSTERNHELSHLLTIYCWIKHIVVAACVFEEVNAVCKGCYKSLKLLLSPPRPGRNKRAMTPFSAKTTTLGKPKRRSFNPLRSPSAPQKPSKNSPYLGFVGRGVESCVWRGKTASLWIVRVRRLFISPPSFPRFTLNKFLCEPLPLCTQRSLSALNRLCAKVHPLRPISQGNAGTLWRHCEKKEEHDPFSQRNVL